MKVHSVKLGANPISAFVPVPRSEGTDSAPASRPAFEIPWEDQQQGLRVLVKERENGHLIADVFSTDAGLLNHAAVSVALVGAAEYPICKVIPLKVPDDSGCRGSADFGLLSGAVKELGPRLALVVFLLQ